MKKDTTKKDTTKKDTAKTQNNVADAFKKIISAGSPSEISKEFLQTALGQMNKTKDDISTKVTGEMIALVRKIDFIKEFSKFAEDHKFKISAEVEILKKDRSR